jgi:hypothetical protein
VSDELTAGRADRSVPFRSVPFRSVQPIDRLIDRYLVARAASVTWSAVAGLVSDRA